MTLKELKPYMKRFRNRKVWNGFVLGAFQKFKDYAIENNNLYLGIELDIAEAADSVAKWVWNEERDSGITEWGIGYVRICVTNIDNRDGRVCFGRVHNPKVEKLIRTIENDKTKSDYLDSIVDY